MRFQELAQVLRAEMMKGVVSPMADDVFNELALTVFHFQCEANPAYGGFVSRRGVEPSGVRRWEEIPFLPARAFKSAVLVSGNPSSAEGVFRTSGTTRGAEVKGEHHVVDLSLYRSSLLPNFQAHLFPNLVGKCPVLSLLPSPQDAPDSSLSFMMGEVAEAMGDETSAFFVDGRGELDSEGLCSVLEEVSRKGQAILLAGTAFAFVGWMEWVRARGWTIQLPEGSRIMETGGYKGRSTELTRPRFYEELQEVSGVPEGRIVNEYGMTELLSQFYEPILGGAPGVEKGSLPMLEDRYHRGPPWVRTLVLEPLSLDPVGPGEVGVLAHLDLANLGSVAAVLTEDLGRSCHDGFQLLGRNPGSEPRGCSLAMEDFLASRGAGS